MWPTVTNGIMAASPRLVVMAGDPVAGQVLTLLAFIVAIAFLFAKVAIHIELSTFCLNKGNISDDQV